MPMDRTPIKVPNTSTNMQFDEVPIFNNTAADEAEVQRAESLHTGESNQINSNEFRLIKLLTFWHKHPKLWFAQLESEFLVYRIRSDDVKFSSVLRHLDEKALMTVSDIVENPPEKDKYNILKTALIDRFTDSEEKRLRQLLAGIELNDKKPSDLLREIKQLSGGSLADNVLHSLWLQRLPFRVQATLAVVGDVPLNKLAELADKILERDNGLLPICQSVVEVPKADPVTPNLADLEKRIAALEFKCSRSKSRSNYRRRRNFRSKSRDKSDSTNSEICFYHRKFGSKAFKCTVPCSMSKTLALADKPEN
ncbi:PREDICTED: uncharacterized protein LOC108777628 [Cyphomyrmex costatus]|uniref:uncharacterized protein LOC108777628 n=1 Tax=Cyphomyrmex costatus TaxID=456900 RepID=UPI000852245A|nr:PREDICTED: uncharacterized protein LOC108777628 [Cyphomyrmex costatus]